MKTPYRHVRGCRGVVQLPSARFEIGWLALRERLDHAARNRVLAQVLADRLPERPKLLDLGAGTGSLFRFLAPIIGRPQTWILADADEMLLHVALDRTAKWAKRRGFNATVCEGCSPSVLILRTPLGIWRFETMVVNLDSAPRGLPLGAVDSVVCSALLDLTSRLWMERLFADLRTPFYASMTVDGRDKWFPHHPTDLAVRTAFRRDQRRDKGLGPALGSDAADVAQRLLATRGFQTHTATSDWRIPRGALNASGTFAQMTALSAHQAMPVHGSKFAEWTRARLRQAIKARLAIRIGHRDLLAFPPGEWI